MSYFGLIDEKMHQSNAETDTVYLLLPSFHFKGLSATVLYNSQFFSGALGKFFQFTALKLTIWLKTLSSRI